MPGWRRRKRQTEARRIWLTGASLAALVAAAGLFAGSEARAESLRQALAAAYQYNPRLDAERARLRATDEDVTRAESGFRPTIEASADFGHQQTSVRPSVSELFGASDPLGYSVTARQSLFRGFRTTNEVSEAEATVKAGRENLRQVETEVLSEAVEAYCNMVRDLAIARMRDNNVEVLSKDLEGAEARRAVKEVTKTDVAQAQARRARALSAAELARSNVKVSRANFERVIGHAPSTVGQPSLKNAQLPRTLEEALKAAERQNPSLNAAQFQEQAARFAVDKIRGELLPEVNIEANYGHRDDPNPAYTEQDSASITGRVSLSLYDGGEIRARVRQAKHTHVSRLQQIEQARSESQAAVIEAWSQMMASRAQLKSNSILVDANRLALEGVREEQKVGQRTLLDVLDAEQEYLDAQIQLITARRDLIVASYRVLATMGELNPEALALATDVYNPEAHFEEARQNWFGIDIVTPDGRREVIEANDPDDDPGGSAE